jgi:hypothetical protein
LQGFPEDFQKFFERDHSDTEQPVSDTQAYQQFGNSVCVPVVSTIAQNQLEFWENPELINELPDSTEPKQGALFDFEDEQLQALVQ